MLEPRRAILRILAGALLAASWSARADLAIPGADGSDGDFAPTASVEIDLSLAPTAGWSTPGDGRGVYDPTKWAVVFKYSSVNIPVGVTVTFKNHDSRAAVVWLVTGDANIAGTLSLAGQNYLNAPARAEPGPGGYLGGVGYQSLSSPTGGGLGIGGGLAGQYGGSHATAGVNNPSPLYGSRRVLPLVGGSGGGGATSYANGGGGGGGALLLAVTGTLSVDGLISANGGAGRYLYNSGSGAGGAVRLIANALAGTGRIYAVGGQTYYGGEGRIRIEALSSSAAWDVVPVTDVAPPDDPVLLWLPAGAPTVEIVSIAAVAVPPDPRARLELFREDISLPILGGPADIVLATNNVDITDGTVQVRVTPEYGQPVFVDAVFGSGDYESATWVATTSLPEGVFTVQAHAVNPAP
jgi:hypothetical protein